MNIPSRYKVPLVIVFKIAVWQFCLFGATLGRVEQRKLARSGTAKTENTRLCRHLACFRFYSWLLCCLLAFNTVHGWPAVRLLLLLLMAPLLFADFVHCSWLHCWLPSSFTTHGCTAICLLWLYTHNVS